MGSDPTSKDAAIHPEKQSWFSAVGSLVLNFGTLEWLIIHFLKRHLDEESFERSRKLHFKDRLKYVAECLNQPDQAEVDRIAFEKFSKNLNSLRELRNHVAHGHFNCFVGEDMVPRLTISLPRDVDQPFEGESRILEFSELSEGLDCLNEMIELFIRLSDFGVYFHAEVAQKEGGVSISVRKRT